MNNFADLPVPASPGVGASVDVRDIAADKTIVVGGPFQGSITVEASGNGTNFSPVASFTTSKPGQAITIAACFMRVRVQSLTSGSPTVNVAGSAADVLSVTPAVPAGNGAGAGSDTSAMGASKTFFVTGSFTGTVTIEGSNDDVNYAPIASVAANDHKSVSAIARFLRVRRAAVNQVNPGTPVVVVCGTGDVGFAQNVGITGVPGNPADAVETRIFARPGGSDESGDGRTAATAYATISRALRDVPQFIVGARYIIDCAGVSEQVTEPLVLRPYFSCESSVFDSTPPEAGFVNRAPLTFEAEMTVIDTITAPELTGQTTDSVTSLRTLQTTKNYAADEQRGRLFRDANGQTGAIAGNTAGPNSSIELAEVSSITAPIEIVEPSCEIRNISTTNALELRSINCRIQFNGIRLTKDSGSSFVYGVFGDAVKQGVSFTLCQIDGFFFTAGVGGSTAPSFNSTAITSRAATTGISFSLFSCLVDTAVVALRHAGVTGDTCFFFENIFESPGGAIGGSTGIEDTNNVAISVDQTEVRNSAGDGFFCNPISALRLRRTNINNCAGNAVTISGSICSLDNLQGSGNGGIGLSLQNGSQAERLNGSAVTGTGGDYQVGGNAVGTWGAFGGNETDIGAGSPQLCRLFT